MAERPLLQVLSMPAGGYAAHCSQHGYLTMWGVPLLANLDLWGHAAHHHTRPTPHTSQRGTVHPSAPPAS